jgi:hypothetical protein
MAIGNLIVVARFEFELKPPNLFNCEFVFQKTRSLHTFLSGSCQRNAINGERTRAEMGNCSCLSSTPCSCIVLSKSLPSLMRRSTSIKCWR